MGRFAVNKSLAIWGLTSDSRLWRIVGSLLSPCWRGDSWQSEVKAQAVQPGREFCWWDSTCDKRVSVEAPSAISEHPPSPPQPPPEKGTKHAPPPPPPPPSPPPYGDTSMEDSEEQAAPAPGFDLIKGTTKKVWVAPLKSPWHFCTFHAGLRRKRKRPRRKRRRREEKGEGEKRKGRRREERRCCSVSLPLRSLKDAVGEEWVTFRPDAIVTTHMLRLHTNRQVLALTHPHKVVRNCFSSISVVQRSYSCCVLCRFSPAND